MPVILADWFGTVPLADLGAGAGIDPEQSEPGITVIGELGAFDRGVIQLREIRLDLPILQRQPHTRAWVKAAALLAHVSPAPVLQTLANFGPGDDPLPPADILDLIIYWQDLHPPNLLLRQTSVPNPSITRGLDDVTACSRHVPQCGSSGLEGE